MNDSNSAEDNKITPDRKKYFPHLRLSLLRCRLGFLVSIAARGRSWCAWGPTTPSRCGWWICLSLGRSRFSSGSGCRSFVGSFGGFGEGGSCFLQYRHHIRFRGRLKIKAQNYSFVQIKHFVRSIRTFCTDTDRDRKCLWKPTFRPHI